MDVEQPARYFSDREVAHGENTELELNRLIERRDLHRRLTEPERLEEEVWAKTCREHAEQQRAQARIEWHLHHQGQAERLRHTLEDLASYHEMKAEQFLNDGGDAA